MSSILVYGPSDQDNYKIGNLVLKFFGYGKSEHYSSGWSRSCNNDFDYSIDGHIREAQRMKNYANTANIHKFHAICSFQAPTKECVDIFLPDVSIFVHTSKLDPYCAHDLELCSFKNIPSTLYKLLEKL